LGDNSLIVPASVTSASDNSIAGSGTATGNSNSGIVNSLPIVQEECYGAVDCNPTGNPIGGGAGYSRIIPQADPKVKYIVSTKEQLLSALSKAISGEVVFVKKNAVIDMSGEGEVIIPAGVTLASDRGLGSSSGALIKKTQNGTQIWNEALFVAKQGARITGFRIEGEMKPANDDTQPERQKLAGLHTHESMEVDNNEIRGWSCSGVMIGGASNTGGNAYIHHNYIHHNQAGGLGYGVSVAGGSALIEANIFDYNKHSVSGSGFEGESYEARYNHELGHGIWGFHRFDVHRNPTGYSGYSYQVHHNTFENVFTQDPYGANVWYFRYSGGEPELGVWIDHNIFEWSNDWESRPCYSQVTKAGKAKTYVSNNMVGIPPTTLKRDGTGVIQFLAE